jgi:hypothetical protein
VVLLVLDRMRRHELGRAKEAVRRAPRRSVHGRRLEDVRLIHGHYHHATPPVIINLLSKHI